MITFPCAKINIGLNVVKEREDGYHDIETIFYPIPLYDALELNIMDDKFPSEFRCDLKTTGNEVECKESENIVVKAYDLLAKDFTLPRLHCHLHKAIPSQAGLGGGSSDAAFMIKMLNEGFGLGLSTKDMEQYAAKLGADCAFFISSTPSFANGIGDKLQKLSNITFLKGYHLIIVKPEVSISTKEAYKAINPSKPSKRCVDAICQPIELWKDNLSNDFEGPAFAFHPILSSIKQELYNLGALYAQMSGSGSAMFGIFKSKLPDSEIIKSFGKYYSCQLTL